VKLNLKVGIFISDNTDLWLTDASYSGHHHSLYLRKKTSFRDIDQDLADNEKTVNIKI
jgi:hypothetical protein